VRPIGWEGVTWLPAQAPRSPIRARTSQWHLPQQCVKKKKKKQVSKGERRGAQHGLHFDRLEKLQPYVVPPWWEPPFTKIAVTADTAIEDHDAMELGTICIFTDGSGVAGHVGAAVLAPFPRLGGINTRRCSTWGHPMSLQYTQQSSGEWSWHCRFCSMYTSGRQPGKCKKVRSELGRSGGPPTYHQLGPKLLARAYLCPDVRAKSRGMNGIKLAEGRSTGQHIKARPSLQEHTQ
jgi:hypothetical protein